MDHLCDLAESSSQRQQEHVLRISRFEAELHMLRRSARDQDAEIARLQEALEQRRQEQQRDENAISRLQSRCQVVEAFNIQLQDARSTAADERQKLTDKLAEVTISYQEERRRADDACSSVVGLESRLQQQQQRMLELERRGRGAADHQDDVQAKRAILELELSAKIESQCNDKFNLALQSAMSSFAEVMFAAFVKPLMEELEAHHRWLVVLQQSVALPLHRAKTPLNAADMALHSLLEFGSELNNGRMLLRAMSPLSPFAMRVSLVSPSAIAAAAMLPTPSSSSAADTTVAAAGLTAAAPPFPTTLRMALTNGQATNSFRATARHFVNDVVTAVKCLVSQAEHSGRGPHSAGVSRRNKVREDDGGPTTTTLAVADADPAGVRSAAAESVKDHDMSLLPEKRKGDDDDHRPHSPCRSGDDDDGADSSSSEDEGDDPAVKGEVANAPDVPYQDSQSFTKPYLKHVPLTLVAQLACETQYLVQRLVPLFQAVDHWDKYGSQRRFDKRLFSDAARWPGLRGSRQHPMALNCAAVIQLPPPSWTSAVGGDDNNTTPSSRRSPRRSSTPTSDTRMPRGVKFGGTHSENATASLAAVPGPNAAPQPPPHVPSRLPKEKFVPLRRGTPPQEETGDDDDAAPPPPAAAATSADEPA